MLNDSKKSNKDFWHIWTNHSTMKYFKFLHSVFSVWKLESLINNSKGLAKTKLKSKSSSWVTFVKCSINCKYSSTWASLVAQQCRICLQRRSCRFDPWAGKIPWRRAWQPTPVILSGESHGQRSLVGYNPQGCKESDMTKAT